MRNAYLIKFWSEDLKEWDHSEDVGAGWKELLECILNKYGEGMWTAFSRQGYCVHGNEISYSIKEEHLFVAWVIIGFSVSSLRIKLVILG
jgi:hypothetical protein